MRIADSDNTLACDYKSQATLPEFRPLVVAYRGGREFLPAGTIDNKAITNIAGDVISTGISTFNMNTIDNYIFQINQ